MLILSVQVRLPATLTADAFPADWLDGKPGGSAEPASTPLSAPTSGESGGRGGVWGWARGRGEAEAALVREALRIADVPLFENLAQAADALMES